MRSIGRRSAKVRCEVQVAPVIEQSVQEHVQGKRLANCTALTAPRTTSVALPMRFGWPACAGPGRVIQITVLSVV